MYEGLYAYADEHRVRRSIFTAARLWRREPDASARRLVARSSTLIDTTTPSDPHSAARAAARTAYAGLYRFARERFTPRDLVAEYVVGPGEGGVRRAWTRGLTRAPRAFAADRRRAGSAATRPSSAPARRPAA